MENKHGTNDSNGSAMNWNKIIAINYEYLVTPVVYKNAAFWPENIVTKIHNQS